MSWQVEAFDSDAQGVRPLKQGEEHPDKEAMQHSKMEKVFKVRDSPNTIKHGGLYLRAPYAFVESRQAGAVFRSLGAHEPAPR